MVHINPAMTHNSLVFVTYEHVNKSKDYCQYSKWKYKAQYYGVRINRRLIIYLWRFQRFSTNYYLMKWNITQFL